MLSVLCTQERCSLQSVLNQSVSAAFAGLQRPNYREMRTLLIVTDLVTPRIVSHDMASRLDDVWIPAKRKMWALGTWSVLDLLRLLLASRSAETFSMCWLYTIFTSHFNGLQKICAFRHAPGCLLFDSGLHGLKKFWKLRVLSSRISFCPKTSMILSS